MITHRQLVLIAEKWIMSRTSCGIAFSELKTINAECPDVIGFGSWVHSVIAECKISRSDFLADKKKKFRQNPDQGMGSQRIYFCPTGLIKTSELPTGWGLVYVNDRLKAKAEYLPYKGNIGERMDRFNKNQQAEHNVMYSALRRLHLRGRIKEIYEPLIIY